jgi:ketosteroid isomerase-like protein
MGNLTFSEVAVRILAPNVALATGKYELKRTAAAGGDAGGRFTLILRKTSAGWKITHDHTS